MAGTRETLCVRDPGHAAAEVRAFPVHGKETAVCKAREVELAVRKCGHATGFESLDRPGNDDARSIHLRSLALARHQYRHCNPAGLENRDRTKQPHCTGKEATPVGVYICHGHTSIMPGPRNQAPATVRTTKATKKSTNNDCTASFRLALNDFLSAR